MLAIPLSLLASLAPTRLRERLRLGPPPPAATTASGILEIVLAAALMWRTSMAYQGTRGNLEPGIGAAGGEAWLAWMLGTPLGVVVPYLLVEGAIRTAAGVAGGSCGVLPLWLVDRLLHGAAKGAQQAWARPPGVDHVEKLAGGYRIRATHDHGWTAMTTIDVHGAPHRVVESRSDAPGSHPFAWFLAPVPPGWLDRMIVRYDPHALVRAARGPSAVPPPRLDALGRAVAAQLPTQADVIGGAAALLIAPLVALLPERLRERPELAGVPIPLATMLTGFVELGLGLIAWLLLMSRFGVMALPTLVALAVTLEGAVRAAVGFSGSGCGLALTWALDRVLRPGAHRARPLPPLVDDVPLVDGAPSAIHSCRARPWVVGTRLVIDGATYAVAHVSEEPGELRPWRYALVAATGEGVPYWASQIVEEAPR